jgi:hypothetical protein
MEEIDVILQARDSLKEAIRHLENDLSDTLGSKERSHKTKLLRHFRDALVAAEESLNTKGN